MRYWNSYFKLFKQDQWYLTLLWLALIPIIPVVGVMVVEGYMADLLHRRSRDASAPEPSFDISRFVDYLKLGVWPFLVMLVAQLVLMVLLVPVLAICALPLLLLLVNQDVLTMVLAIGASVVLGLICGIGIMLVMIPLRLRAVMLQDFGAAFSWSWSVDFIRKTGFSCLLAHLFLVVTTPLLVVAGYLCCCVGVIPAMAWVSYANLELLMQLYEVYLKRDGQPLTPPMN